MTDYEYYFTIRYSGSRDDFGNNKIHLSLLRGIPQSFFGIPYRANVKVLFTKWNITQNKDEIQRAMDELKLNISTYEKEEDAYKQQLKQSKEHQKCVTRMIMDINGKKIDK
jgi:hypothetical protein